MKLLVSFFVCSLGLTRGLAQDTTLVLNTSMFNAEQQINLATASGWIYRAGHNPDWASPNLNTLNWVKRKPTDLSVKDADKTGRVEGWFRLRLELDSTFKGIPTWIRKSTWSAVDLYVDGKLLASYGSTGAKGDAYQEYFFTDRVPTPVRLIPGHKHLLAFHLVDYKAPFSLTQLKSEIYVPVDYSLRLVGPRYYASDTNLKPLASVLNTSQFAAALFSTLLLWLLVWQDVGNKSVIRLLAIQTSLVAFVTSGTVVTLIDPSLGTFAGMRLADLVQFLSVALLAVILLRMADHSQVRRLTVVSLVMPVLASGIDTVVGPTFIGQLVFALLVLILVYVMASSWTKLYGAPRAIVVGIIISFAFALLFIINVMVIPASSLRSIFMLVLSTAYSSTIPLSFLVYVALRFKEILAEDRMKAAAVVQITEEKRQLLATQNQLLEQQVDVRTHELNTSLQILKATQTQLIQKEKLASLGELTAGIAHEIQNPLNFVNNFSEVSTELVDELEDELAKGDTDEAKAIVDDIRQNLQKIHHHGGRASSIVQGMLAHSRSSMGEVQPTDLNALADEYLKIAYHGWRAKDANRNVDLKTNFRMDLCAVEVVPQEIGRVLLNLYNNAFYAVGEKQKAAFPNYQPTVWVSTTQVNGQTQIRVNDNGTGIPESVKAKIFQPFFTTKPTGEGTGLGLSLSYDIVTKGHGGSLTVESQEGEGTTFVIQLPALR